MDWEELLGMGIMLGVPGGLSLFFAVSLIQFFRTDKEDTKRRKKWKILAIVAASLLALLVLGFIALVIMLSMAMSHM